MAERLLEVTDLAVDFASDGGRVQAVRGVDFGVEAGRTLAIVGESGCGKSVTVQALMGLVPMPPGRILRGSARFFGEDLLTLAPRRANALRGARIGMVFQDPMTSMNPTMRVGDQIAETLRLHRGLSPAAATRQAVELLEQCRIPDPQRRARNYPFEFSGGMLQRAMIAMAIACQPALLIADEPTTALDVTIQAQILRLLQALQARTGMTMILITHDLGVVARMADEVAVMYAGRIVERGSVESIFRRPAHPYTLGLQQAMPDPASRAPLRAIAGAPPDLFQPPTGCGYHPRCPHALRICQREEPPLQPLDADVSARCWLHHPQAPAVAPLHQPLRDGRGAP